MLCNCYPPSGVAGEAWSCPTHSSITSPMTTRYEQAIARIEEERGRLTTEIKAAEDNKEWLVGRHGIDGYDMHLKQDRTQLSAWTTLKDVLELHEEDVVEGNRLVAPRCIEDGEDYPCPTAEKIIEGMLRNGE